MNPEEIQSIKDLFKKLQITIHQTAREKGWWKDRDAVVDLCTKNQKDLEPFARKLVISLTLALTHSELSEGLEGLRKDLPDDKCPEFPMIVVEMADAIIRLMDLAEAYNWPLVEAIIAKTEMNRGREYLHGGKAF